MVRERGVYGGVEGEASEAGYKKRKMWTFNQYDGVGVSRMGSAGARDHAMQKRESRIR